MNQLMRRFLFFLILSSAFLDHVSLIAQRNNPRLNVGLLIMATGKYTVFLEKLVASADMYFLPGHNRTYFIFTDGQAPQASNIVRIEQQRLGWPYDTMMRFNVYLNAASYFADFDYLFACDADMLFKGDGWAMRFLGPEWQPASGICNARSSP